MVALSFYSSHGSNIKLSDLQTAEHNYHKAQGLFILAAPLTEASKFQLRFEGKGVVKIHTVLTKEEAIAWVERKKPLPKGCIRLRNVSSFVWEVSFDPDLNKVRFANERVKETRSGTMLIFDIEYGNVRVTALSAGPEVVFDPIHHSQHIRTIRRIGFSSASLMHFNPSGLCRLSSPVKKGQVFRLRIRGNRGTSGIGPYFRLRVAQASDFEQDVPQFLGLSSEDTFCSDMLLMESSQTRDVFISCCDGPRGMNRTGANSEMEVILSWPGQGMCFFWCELNKVSLSVQLINNLLSRPVQSTRAMHGGASAVPDDYVNSIQLRPAAVVFTQSLTEPKVAGTLERQMKNTKASDTSENHHSFMQDMHKYESYKRLPQGNNSKNISEEETERKQISSERPGWNITSNTTLGACGIDECLEETELKVVAGSNCKGLGEYESPLPVFFKTPCLDLGGPRDPKVESENSGSFYLPDHVLALLPHKPSVNLRNPSNVPSAIGPLNNIYDDIRSYQIDGLGCHHLKAERHYSLPYNIPATPTEQPVAQDENKTLSLTELKI